MTPLGGKRQGSVTCIVVVSSTDLLLSMCVPHSVVASSYLAMESSAHTLLVIVIATTVAVTMSHSTIALDVLLQSVALVVGQSTHASDGIMKASAEADASLADALPSKNAARGVSILGVGNALASHALSTTSTSLATTSRARYSWESRPLVRVEVGEHAGERPAESCAPEG